MAKVKRKFFESKEKVDEQPVQVVEEQQEKQIAVNILDNVLYVKNVAGVVSTSHINDSAEYVLTFGCKATSLIDLLNEVDWKFFNNIADITKYIRNILAKYANNIELISVAKI